MLEAFVVFEEFLMTLGEDVVAAEMPCFVPGLAHDFTILRARISALRWVWTVPLLERQRTSPFLGRDSILNPARRSNESREGGI